MRTVYCLKCPAIYGRTVIIFINKQARDDRANQLAHAGHGVVTYVERH